MVFSYRPFEGKHRLVFIHRKQSIWESSCEETVAHFRAFCEETVALLRRNGRAFARKMSRNLLIFKQLNIVFFLSL